MRALFPANAQIDTAVDAAEAEPESTRAAQINTALPELIASAAAEQHVPLLHFSTDYVFDGLRTLPYTEEDAVNPLGVYAKTKQAGEAAVLAHGGTVFRLQWVFDVRGKNFFLTMKKLLILVQFLTNRLRTRHLL